MSASTVGSSGGISPWNDRHPIRSTLFSAERFEDHARSLADGHITLRGGRPDTSLLQRLDDNAKALLASYDEIDADVAANRHVAPAGEWLIDNMHIVEKQIRGIRDSLPRSYFEDLPTLGSGFLEGHPRVFAIAWAYVAHSDSHVAPDVLARFVRAYESRKALSIGELWAVGVMLKIALIENMRRVTDLLAADARDARAADEAADRLLGLSSRSDGPADPQVVLPHGLAGRSPAFAVQLLRRLTGTNLTATIDWLRAEIAAQGLDPETVVHDVHQAGAVAAVTMRNIFTSLRTISDLAWEEWFDEVSLIEHELRTNPGYRAADKGTRGLYRSALQEFARGSGQSEIDVTRSVLQRSAYADDPLRQDIGYWLLDDGRAEFGASLRHRRTWRARTVDTMRRMGLAGYLGALTALTVVLSVLSMWLLDAVVGPIPTGWLIAGAVAIGLPMSDLALNIVNVVTARLVAARPLPALSLSDGIPDRLRTLVVIPTMITSPDGVDELIADLEVHLLANDEGEVYFAAATDWADADAEHMPDDDDLLQRTILGIRGLNDKYGQRFLLFHRPRRWNDSQGVWMGWERKRGKLEQLNALLQGIEQPDMTVAAGRLPGPFRYVVTLDSDTRLPRESVRRLVGKMAHPLNQAVMGARGRVRRGYGILQPRVTPSLPLAEESSTYQRIYSTTQGTNPYASTVSDAYQDLFGEGSFSGKGIYDLPLVTAAWEGRIPENAVLSHDLLEGNYARSGMVTDVEVVEAYPTSYAVSSKRDHRWIRGDWQLLPWMTTRREGLSGLGLWKMIDNLRRSIVPIAVVLGIVLGVALLPAWGALTLILLLLAAYFIPPFFALPSALLHTEKGVIRSSHIGAVLKDLSDGVTLGATNVVFLGHRAALNVDAIVRTLVRLVTRKNLLEWTTAAASAAGSPNTLAFYRRFMGTGLIPPAILLVVALWRGPWSVLVASPLVVAWAVAPIVARTISRPQASVDQHGTQEDLDALRLVGRRTWHFFETFVGESDHHLPPDNFQEDPEPVVAHRTSPTNIGLYLLVCIAAADAGWIGREEAVSRLEKTLDTVDRLEKYKGHLLNWYDTTSLAPLPPAYVSMVDSGNLAGHLIALHQACTEWAGGEDRLDGFDRLTGTRDALDILAEVVADHPSVGASVQAVGEASDVVRTAITPDDSGTVDLDRAHLAALDLVTVVAEAEGVPALEAATAGTPTAWAQAVVRSIEGRLADARLASGEAPALSGRLVDIARRARSLAMDMDFRFLMDTSRGLFAIGYHVPNAQLDQSCYDLLASEARLGSFVAIAKGDARTRHWATLGRPLCAAGGGSALASWSGSMFEYLMPALVMRQPSTGLLATTMRRVVQEQVSYTADSGVPWGVSESAYNARDVYKTYQYSPFGLPSLGLVRGLSDNLVIAPYATGLAAMVDPGLAAANYDRLTSIGARGHYGYYEAVDFTPGRLPIGESHAVVKCYMAHHQGMTLLSIHNALHDGVMRERFHADPVVAACDLLLQERAPRTVPITPARGRTPAVRSAPQAPATPSGRSFTGSATGAPAVHHLSNGRMSLTLTPSGGGCFMWNGNALTRWRSDRTTEKLGNFVYLRDDESGRHWTAVGPPTGAPAETDHVHFASDSATFERSVEGIRSKVEWRISPEADVAVRRVTLANDGDTDRQISVASYAELVLGAIADDEAHPVFSKMFVHTEFDEALNAIIAYRRPRGSDTPQVWFGHMLVVTPPRVGGVDEQDGAEVGPCIPQTDRRAFIGRGRSLADPAAVSGAPGSIPDVDPGSSLGYTLDPIASLMQAVRIPARGKVRLTFYTAAAATREDLTRILDQHRRPTAYERITALCWTEDQIQLRYLGITAAEADTFQRLAGHVRYPNRVLLPEEEEAIAGAGPQSSLWPLGISGDLPIVLVRIDDAEDVALVRQMTRAFEFWRMRGFSADIVILNDRGTSYIEDLQHRLDQIVSAARPLGESSGGTGGLFVVRADQASADTLGALLATARVVLYARRGELDAQLPRAARMQKVTPRIVPTVPEVDTEPTPAPSDLQFFNSYGGFTPDGTEYVTILEEGEATPAPWANVIANPAFGFHATAEGAGYTWWRNSRDNQITPWGNDPVLSPVSEPIYVTDLDSGVVSSPMAGVIDTGRHVARHGFGYTRYLHRRDGLDLDLVQFVPGEDPVKVSWLQVRNLTDSPRRIAVTSYADLVLGNKQQDEPWHLVTGVDSSGALFVRNPWSVAYPDQVIGFDMAGQQTSLTASRLEMLGRNGDLSAPAGVLSGRPLSGRVGAGIDPCAALQRVVDLPAGGVVSVPVIMVAGADEAAARDLVERYRAADPAELLARTRADWTERLGQIQVASPDPSFDVMMNGWLLYQTLSCRLFARSGYYQASGAYGFRDQLQDSMAVLLVDPAPARAQLLRAAGRQFEEGDVQHWWLPATGAGVRTRISDDVVWLAQACAHYLRVTGDVSVLDEVVPFLHGPVLEDDQHENYFQPETSTRTATLLEHVVLGLERAFTAGAHGLPLMGTGDWNDGMNRVGQYGRGESVWLGWFLHRTLSDIMPTLEERVPEFAERARAHQQSLLAALEENGWDGAWYRRGYFDDGTPLGSSLRPECRIDAIAQSWAALSGAALPERALSAMTQVDQQLMMSEEGIARLFTPPFEVSDPDPGYIRSYPPGVRENGGQYTHGAIWSIFANAALGRQHRAGEIFAMINPVNHALDADQAEVYRTEPYVVAADVYSVAPYTGRGGWTWYTGSSGWLFRAGVEAILGVRRVGDALEFDPCLPDGWPGVSVTYRVAGADYRVTIDAADSPTPRRVASIILDGVPQPGITVPLLADGQTHQVDVVLRHAPELGAVIDGVLAEPTPDDPEVER